MSGSTVAIVLAFCAPVHAGDQPRLGLDLEPYLKGGTLAWDQLGSIGGHKFQIGAGLRSRLRRERLGCTLDVEYWWVGEGLDDDKGFIPREGLHARGDVRWHFPLAQTLELFPFAGFGYERWDRGSGAIWEKLDFPYAMLGGGVAHERAYVRAGLNLPFAAGTDTGLTPDPRLGFSAEVGFRAARVTVGLYYHYAGVQDPDAKLIQAGLFAGYRFTLLGGEPPPS